MQVKRASSFGEIGTGALLSLFIILLVKLMILKLPRMNPMMSKRMIGCLTHDDSDNPPPVQRSRIKA